MTKLIKLTEITKEGDGTKSQPMLINPEIIATVTTSKLEKSGPHIIGETQGEPMTFIQFRNNNGTFVQESLQEIEKLVAFDYFSAPQSAS